MRKDLGISLHLAGSLGGDFDVTLDFKITGDKLMLWLKGSADLRAAEPGVPTHAGTQADPWILDKYDQFVKAWTTLRRDKTWLAKDCYFKVGGRLIHKFPADESHGGVKGGHAEGFYMADDVLSGTGAGEAVWKKVDGASYADFAKTFRANMQTSKKNEADWSIAKAQKLRSVLNGGVDYSGKGSDSTSASLPLLASVMFLAEPARNPRTFPIGLMLLDMIGDPYNVAGTKFYILDRVLAHPDRIAGNTVPSKAQLGPAGRDWTTKGGATVGLTPLAMALPPKRAKGVMGLAQVEGKWSASPSGSARTQDALDIANDYIQMKELSILARWVAKMLQPTESKSQQFLTVTALRHDDVTVRPDLFATASIKNLLPSTMDEKKKKLYDEVFTGLKSELSMRITKLIQTRISSFNLMP